MTEAIGYAAAVIGTFVMVPQVIQSLRTKSVKDLSTVMLVAYILQSILWSTYGYLIHAVPVLLCNVVACCIGLFQAFLKRRYRAA